MAAWKKKLQGITLCYDGMKILYVIRGKYQMGKPGLGYWAFCLCSEWPLWYFLDYTCPGGSWPFTIGQGKA